MSDTPLTDALEAEDWLDGGPSDRKDWAASEYFVRKAIVHARQMELDANNALNALADLRATRGDVPESTLDAERYRWFRDCGSERQIEIVEMAEGKRNMLEHHIDKGMCGL